MSLEFLLWWQFPQHDQSEDIEERSFTVSRAEAKATRLDALLHCQKTGSRNPVVFPSSNNLLTSPLALRLRDAGVYVQFPSLGGGAFSGDWKKEGMDPVQSPGKLKVCANMLLLHPIIWS